MPLSFLPVVHSAFWLCVLLHWAAAIQVEDNEPSFNYVGIWAEDDNGNHSGGCARRTNDTGATVTYSFLGSAVSLYGVTSDNGARFSFSTNGGPSLSCTSWRNDSTQLFQTELCIIAGLDASVHTVTITHTDNSGRWLYVDFLDISPSSSSILTWVSSTTTSTSAAHTSVRGSSTSGAQKKKSSINIGAIAGGAIAGLAILCAVVFVIVRSRRTQRQLEAPGLSGAGEPPIVAAFRDAHQHDGPRAVTGNVAGPSRSETMGTSSTYQPYTTSADMSMTNNNSFSLLPPPTLLSTLERASLQVPSTSDSRGGSPSVFPTGVASNMASREELSVPHTLASQEDPFSSPLHDVWGSPEVEMDVGSPENPQPDPGSQRSPLQSPPPSYRTRMTR